MNHPPKNELSLYKTRLSQNPVLSLEAKSSPSRYSFQQGYDDHWLSAKKRQQPQRSLIAKHYYQKLLHQSGRYSFYPMNFLEP